MVMWLQRVFAIMLAAAALIAVIIVGYYLLSSSIASTSLSTTAKVDILSAYETTGRIIAMVAAFAALAIMVVLLAKDIIKSV